MQTVSATPEQERARIQDIALLELLNKQFMTKIIQRPETEMDLRKQIELLKTNIANPADTECRARRIQIARLGRKMAKANGGGRKTRRHRKRRMTRRR